MTWNEEIIKGEIESIQFAIDHLKDRIDDLKQERQKAEINLEQAKESIRGIDGFIKQKTKQLDKEIENLNDLKTT